MTKGSTCFHFKVSLKDVTPEVWRRFVVPHDFRLDRFHDLIQIVMGWSDSHLHEFSIGGKRYSELSPDGDSFGEPPNDETQYTLEQLVKKPGDKLSYEYDFGDSWEHEIELEAIEPIPEGFELKICCIDGKNACPPEDVGGPFGYMEFLKTISDPKHPERNSMLDWAAETTGKKGKFNPKRFNEDEVSRDILKYLRWSRNRK